MATVTQRPARPLEVLDRSQPHAFAQPTKKIHEGQDVSAFLTSKAYADLMTFLLQLNRSMFPSKVSGDETPNVQTWELCSDAVEYSEPVRRLQTLLQKLEAIIDEAPPDTGPRRFGNVSFRKWHQILEERASELLDDCLPDEVLEWKTSSDEEVTAKSEIKAYFLGGFGSAQRLDYGSGHELSFLAFLAGIWKLNGFPKTSPGVEERGIVLGVFEPYLELIRRLILTYTLEPAGSHGVWGLDDHSFIPYIFGSAQCAPAISESDETPTEGSLPGAPDPSGVAKSAVVQRERKTNMYFSAIGFIYDVKKGPFWEHSPMLYDISGIKDGWGKINKGMIKMYNAEVLSKFPVVQHFPFGSLFSWDRDPNAATPPPSTHSSTRTERPGGAAASTGTAAPWATPTAVPRQPLTPTAAPWANPGAARVPPGSMPSTRAPWANPGAQPSDPNVPTRAPWARDR